jgi:hypothetical protein
MVSQKVGPKVFERDDLKEQSMVFWKECQTVLRSGLRRASSKVGRMVRG